LSKWWKAKILLQKHGDKEDKRVKLRTPWQVNAERTRGRAGTSRNQQENAEREPEG